MNIFRIYKFTYFLWIIVFFYLAIITIFAQSFQLDKVLITVDKETITQNELLLIYEQIEAEIGNKLLPEEKARLINDLILELLLLVEAKRFRVNVDPTEVNQYLLNFQKINQLSSKDLEQLLKDRGQDIRYFRREIKKKKIGEIMLRRVQASIKVNDEEIEQLYQDIRRRKIFGGYFFDKVALIKNLRRIFFLIKLLYFFVIYFNRCLYTPQHYFAYFFFLDFSSKITNILSSIFE